MVGSRGAFDEALAVLDARGDRVAIVLADIDWFKQVNDRLGHVTGDQILVQTAQAMLECLRQDDQPLRRSEERRVGKESGSTCRSRRWPSLKKKTKKKTRI